jgi:hypothetical protein
MTKRAIAALALALTTGSAIAADLPSYKAPHLPRLRHRCGQVSMSA